MAHTLGNNRDYKTSDRRARKGLAKHAARMAELMAQGMPKDEASRQAFAEMTKNTEREARDRAVDRTICDQKVITAAEFWENASPRLVRELYKNAGLAFTESVLFSGVEFWQLAPELKVAIYEHPLFRKGDY